MLFYKFTEINFKSQFGAYVTGVDLNDISGKARYFEIQERNLITYAR